MSCSFAGAQRFSVETAGKFAVRGDGRGVWPPGAAPSQRLSGN